MCECVPTTTNRADYKRSVQFQTSEYLHEAPCTPTIVLLPWSMNRMQGCADLAGCVESVRSTAHDCGICLFAAKALTKQQSFA